MKNNENLRKFIRQTLSESISLDNQKWYSDKLDGIYYAFQALEKEYNSYGLDQLKREYKLATILGEANKLMDTFDAAEEIFKQEQEDVNDNSYHSVENAFYILNNLIGEFVAELEKLKEIFISMGDLDKGSHYFQKHSPILI